MNFVLLNVRPEVFHDVSLTFTLIRACFMAEIFVEIQLLHQFGLSLFCILYAWYWCGKHLKVFSTICCFSAVDIQRYPYTPQTWLECKNHRVIAGYTRLYFGKKVIYTKYYSKALSMYRGHFSSYNWRTTLHSSPVKAMYGGSFVSANLTKVLLL